jgi:hypothetical protein
MIGSMKEILFNNMKDSDFLNSIAERLRDDEDITTVFRTTHIKPYSTYRDAWDGSTNTDNGKMMHLGNAINGSKLNSSEKSRLKIMVVHNPNNLEDMFQDYQDHGDIQKAIEDNDGDYYDA